MALFACYAAMVTSRVIDAKRALVRVLKDLAATYSVALALNRDASDEDVRKAYKKVLLRAHPDKGGAHADVLRRVHDGPRVERAARGARGAAGRGRASARLRGGRAEGGGAPTRERRPHGAQKK